MTMTKKSVMIVDDDPNVVETIVSSLKDTYEVDYAYGANEAIEKLASGTFEVMLLDINMPETNGYELCKKIKINEKLSPTHVIFLSGYNDVDARLKCYLNGGDDFISKPFNLAELTAKIEAHFRSLFREHDLANKVNNLSSEMNRQVDHILKLERRADVGLNVVQIIHNIRNIMTLLPQCIDQVDHALPGNKIGSKMRSIYERLDTISKSILFSVKEENPNDNRHIDLNEVIRNELSLFEYNEFFRYKTKLRLHLQPLPKIEGSQTRFSQVFTNLIQNALEAMVDSATRILSISTYCERDHIVVVISDTGSGILPEHREKLFKTLFTTKDGRNGKQGTGFGLSYCKRVIESYHGKILVESDPNLGTIFRIELPITTANAA